MTGPRAPGAPAGLQLDLICAIARLEQIGREGADTCGGVILDRLVTCDAPRLRRHLTTETRAWWAAVEAADDLPGFP